MSFETMVKIKADALLLARLYACVYDRAWQVLEAKVASNADPEYVLALARGPEASAHLLGSFVTGLARDPAVVAAYPTDAGVTDKQISAVVTKVWNRTAPKQADPAPASD